MSAYEDADFDDGRFADDGYDDCEDDYDIPTYDELDIEGRYYTYGSRAEYNAWRAAEISALIEAEKSAQQVRKLRVVRKTSSTKSANKSTQKTAQNPLETASNVLKTAFQSPVNAYEPQSKFTPQTFLLWCVFFAIVFLFVFYCIIA